MQAQRCIGERFHSRVAAADMVLLMQDNIVLFRLRERGWKVDFRAEKADDKGRVNRIRQIDIIPQPDRADQPAASARRNGIPACIPRCW